MILENQEKELFGIYLFDNSCLLLVKWPLLGFSISIRQNTSPIGIGFKGNPGLSTFKILVSKKPSVIEEFLEEKVCLHLN